MKIFVTGDNHIGKTYDNHSAREAIIAERMDALTRMVQKANDERCELFAVTGDIFESQRVSKKSVRAVVDALCKFEGTVVIIPGNHDYYDTDAEVWKTFKDYLSKNDIDNIALLTKYEPYAIDEIDTVIYPAFCDMRHSAENKLGWIKSENFPEDGKIRIGMAHGAVDRETIDNEGEYFIMTREELGAISVDAWLIGHTHVPFPKNLTEEFSAVDVNVFNPGTHVQTGVNNNTEGLCFILEFDEKKNLRAKKYVSGNIRFYRKKITVSAGQMERDILDVIKGFDGNSVVDLILDGAVSEDEYGNRKATIDKLGERFLEFTYNDDNVMPLITKEKIEREFPAETSFARNFLLKLLSDRKEAQLAYNLLKGGKEGKK